MSAAVSMLNTLVPVSGVSESLSLDDSFEGTFDQAITRAQGETFETWCEKFGVDVVKVHKEADICMGLLAFCPFFKAKEYRDEALYDVGCIIHGGEQEYLDFIASV